MSPFFARALFALSALTLTPLAFGQAQTDAGQEVGATASDADPVLVTIEGREIRLSVVEARFQELLRERSGGQAIPQEQIDAMRPNWHSRLLTDMVDDTLLEIEADKNEVSVSPEEVLTFLEKSLTLELKRTGRTRADLAEMIQVREGVSFEAFMKRRAEDPNIRRQVRQVHLLRSLYPTETAVTAEEVEARYARDKARLYERPEEVRASHILIGAAPNEGNQERELKLKKAEEILALCRAPGADFAALAKEHSTGPSGPVGGDLGYFPRSGVMVEAFAAAAHGLEVGGVSAIVPTEFGFHIIKVTDRREARVVPLEDVRAAIQDELLMERISRLRRQHVEELRATAKIVYPEEAGAVDEG